MDAKTLLVVCALIGIGSAIPAQRSEIQPRIIGGQDTEIDKVPYQLSLEALRRHICGAVLLSESYGLTAASCIGWYPVWSLGVRGGSTWSFWLNWMGKAVGVTEFIKHPNWKSGSNDYDVAVLKFSSKMSLGPNIRPIGLAVTTPVAGSTAIVSGWGKSQQWYLNSLRLSSVSTELINRAECSSMYEKPDSITDRMVCAGRGHQGDACGGDEGSPLVSGGLLVGVVSSTVGCNNGKSTVYTSVANQDIRNFIWKYVQA